MISWLKKYVKICCLVGSDENENEIHESEALRLDEPEVGTQLEIEPEVVEENNENSILELSAVEEQLSDLRKIFLFFLHEIIMTTRLRNNYVIDIKLKKIFKVMTLF